MIWKVEIYTERLKLIPCSCEALSIYTTEYDIGSHISGYLEDLKADPSLYGWGVWLAIVKNSNKIIGDLGFKGKPDTRNTVEIGYSITGSEQNKGYATEALKGIIAWAFNDDRVDKITAECQTDNIPSIKVLKKLNMENIRSENGMRYWQLNKDTRIRYNDG